MGLPDRPAERHRAVAAAFTTRVLGTRDWDAPTPVSAWTARDVVAHLIEWSTGFLGTRAGVELPTGPAIGADLAVAWRHHADAVQALLEDPADAARTLTGAPFDGQRLDEVIDRIYTSDIFMHIWDLARATGQDDRLDPDTCAGLLAGMEQMEDVLRSSGHYGARVPVPPGSDVQTRLLGFIGRDPGWHPVGAMAPGTRHSAPGTPRTS